MVALFDCTQSIYDTYTHRHMYVQHIWGVQDVKFIKHILLITEPALSVCMYTPASQLLVAISSHQSSADWGSVYLCWELKEPLQALWVSRHFFYILQRDMTTVQKNWLIVIVLFFSFFSALYFHSLPIFVFYLQKYN